MHLSGSHLSALSPCILSRSVNHLSLGASLPGTACQPVWPHPRWQECQLQVCSLYLCLSLTLYPTHPPSLLVPTVRLVSPDARGGWGGGMVRCLLDSRCCQLTSPSQAHRGTVCMCRAEGKLWGGIYVWGYTGHGIYGIDRRHPVSDRQIALCSPLPLCSWPVSQCHMPHWSFWNISITSREQHNRKRAMSLWGQKTQDSANLAIKLYHSLVGPIKKNGILLAVWK